MATRLVPYYTEVTDYDQAGENALASTLSGFGAWSVIIYNTEVGKTRIWNGSAFQNAPMKNPDGGTYSGGGGGNPEWANVQNKPAVFPPESHSHDGVYSAVGHTHSYEPANSNIQAHIATTHAPTDAQKNSDITKAEIEAKLTGAITSHSHSNTGYTIHVQALTSSPADGATIYFGALPKAPVTAQGTSKIYIRQAGIIKRAEIYCFSGTAGSNESWSMSIRLNNTGDTLIASVAASTSERVFSNTNLNIAVSAGDYIEIKCVNPTWGTNPLTTIFGGHIYIE